MTLSRSNSLFVLLTIMIQLWEVRSVGIQKRSIQAPACTPEWQWMDSHEGDSPCTMAAKVDASCAGGDWQIPALPGPTTNLSYSMLIGSVSKCTCSWAAYNLMSACAICQGVSQAVRLWPTYITNCSASQVSTTTYFPSDSGFRLPDGATIPAWAAVDPRTWDDEKFDEQKANSIHASGTPDVGNPAPPSTHHASKIGPIVGGIVGGIAVIALGIALLLFIVARNRKLRRLSAPPQDLMGSTLNGHSRTPSESTWKYPGGYAPNLASDRLSSHTRVMSPTVATSMHTHNSSVHSFSQFGSIIGSGVFPPPSPPPGRQAAPPMLPMQLPSGDGHVIPFTTLHPHGSSQDLARDRKLLEGGTVPVTRVYDAPNHPPIVGGSSDQEARPPPYSSYPGQETVEDTPMTSRAERRPVHEKMGSVDSQHSWDSRTSANRSGAGRESGSGIDNVVQQMGITRQGTIGSDGQEGNGTGTVGTGLSVLVEAPSPQRLRSVNPDESLADEDVEM